MADITHGTWIKDGKAVDNVFSNGRQVYGRNLVAGTSNPFTMGYGIPHTIWNADKKRTEIYLPTTVTNGEVLPQNVDRSSFAVVAPGTTYTQSIYVSTDAPLTGVDVKMTWFNYGNGHNTDGKNDMSSISENVYRITCTYTWPTNRTDNTIRLFDIFNLTAAFDFTEGTFLYFYQPKFEQGTIATPYSLAPEDVLN